MIRGGAWNNNARNLRSANRNRNDRTNRNNNNGFRLTQSARCPERPFSRKRPARHRVSMSLLPGRAGRSGHIAREGRQGRGE